MKHDQITAVLDVLKRGPATIATIAAVTHLSRTTTHEVLWHAKERGEITYRIVPPTMSEGDVVWEVVK